MTEALEVTLNQPVILSHGSKEGTGNLSFMGGSFYVTGLSPSHVEGTYTGARLGCNIFQGLPSPRRILELKTEKVVSK